MGVSCTIVLEMYVYTEMIPSTRTIDSLGTRHAKNLKVESGKLAGVEVYTASGMQAHF